MTTEDSAAEIKELRRCLNDLASVLSLPAVWSGGSPAHIVQTLLDALLRMLDLDVAYVRLKDPAGERATTMIRVASVEAAAEGAAPQLHDICNQLDQWFGDDPQKWPSVVRQRIGEDEVSIVPLRLGLQSEMGMIAAGSGRRDFPLRTESLLLGVAANQTSIGLQEAWRMSEQKRLAVQLDQRVAQRTSELARANEELQLKVGLLQHIPVAAWTIRPDGTPDFANRGWLDYTGQTLGYVQSKPEAWITAVHPEDSQSAAEVYWNGIQTGQGFAMETRFRRMEDGAYRWHLNRAVPLRDGDGKTVMFVGTSTDIEDLKQSQESLRAAEEKTRLIVDTALDAVVAMDAQGFINSWNKQADSIFGWSKEEAIGRRMSDLIIPEHQRAAHERGLRHFLATGEGPILQLRIETTAVRRNREEFPVELEVVPLRLGQDWAFSAFIRDITESKRAEEQLRQSEHNLRQLTETIPEMLWSATPEGTIDYCNTRVLDYTGVLFEEIITGGWKRVIHPDDFDPLARTWESCVATGTPYRVEARAFHAGDQMYRWCVTSALPLLDPQGRILKWHGTIVDMHDWKQAQEELRTTQAELAHINRVMTMGELAASIAHEVNQPLAAIAASAESCTAWLEHDPPNLAKARIAANRATQAANQASEIVQRIRALFKKTNWIAAPIEINEVITETISLLDREIQRKGVSLTTELSASLPVALGDRVQLQQVILNLVINGAEAMAEAGDPRRLMIRSAFAGPHEILVSISDTGPGFDPQHAARMFAPFFTTKSEGIGMGLSISRSIIEAHGGRLWAVANQPQGSVFHFALPATTANV